MASKGTWIGTNREQAWHRSSPHRHLPRDPDRCVCIGQSFPDRASVLDASAAAVRVQMEGPLVTHVRIEGTGRRWSDKEGRKWTDTCQARTFVGLPFGLLPRRWTERVWVHCGTQTYMACPTHKLAYM